MKDMISLTKYMEVPNAAHIVYFFEDRASYIQNMMAYIKTGIDRGHHLLIIENPTIYNELIPLIQISFCKEQQNCIHYTDGHSFYDYYGDFHGQNILKNFSKLLEPFLKENIKIRTWANVEWGKSEDINIARKIEEFEYMADESVNGKGLMSVCAYSASKVKASLQTSLMRSHEYIMTDTELVRSTLYRN